MVNSIDEIFDPGIAGHYARMIELYVSSGKTQKDAKIEADILKTMASSLNSNVIITYAVEPGGKVKIIHDDITNRTANYIDQKTDARDMSPLANLPRSDKRPVPSQLQHDLPEMDQVQGNGGNSLVAIVLSTVAAVGLVVACSTYFVIPYIFEGKPLFPTSIPTLTPISTYTHTPQPTSTAFPTEIFIPTQTPIPTQLPTETPFPTPLPMIQTEMPTQAVLPQVTQAASEMILDINSCVAQLDLRNTGLFNNDPSFGLTLDTTIADALHMISEKSGLVPNDSFNRISRLYDFLMWKTNPDLYDKPWSYSWDRDLETLTIGSPDQVRLRDIQNYQPIMDILCRYDADDMKPTGFSPDSDVLSNASGDQKALAGFLPIGMALASMMIPIAPGLLAYDGIKKTGMAIRSGGSSMIIPWAYDAIIQPYINTAHEIKSLAAAGYDKIVNIAQKASSYLSVINEEMSTKKLEIVKN
ncbi:MAG: hypothetical protein NDI94_00090 [Candidatus Woesearchaeota archaeon]|nr:hypothetical protein [Candidatus Woesearchaeota archaeon]